MLPKHYLIALNVIQNACLAGRNGTRNTWFYVNRIAQCLRRRGVCLHMVEHDYEQAVNFLNDPIFRDYLNGIPTFLRDLQFIVDSVDVIRNDRELVDAANDFPFPCMDSIRIAATTMHFFRWHHNT